MQNNGYPENGSETVEKFVKIWKKRLTGADFDDKIRKLFDESVDSIQDQRKWRSEKKLQILKKYEKVLDKQKEMM